MSRKEEEKRTVTLSQEYLHSLVFLPAGFVQCPDCKFIFAKEMKSPHRRILFSLIIAVIFLPLALYYFFYYSKYSQCPNCGKKVKT